MRQRRIAFFALALGSLFLHIHAGFLQLTDRESYFALNGSTTDGQGYNTLRGSDSVFASHRLGSQTYTITLWIQESSNSAGVTATILQMQQSGASSQSGSPGTMVPYLYNTPTSVTGCVDTTVVTNQCKTLTKVEETLYSWTHYFISVCKASAQMRICYTSWRGTSVCDTESFLGDIYPFQTTGTAYFGGSPYGQGIMGKLVDVRFYDSSCYTTAQAQFLAVNRRCASTCWNSCWGPDEESCSGLEFLHPYYSSALDDGNIINVGKIEFAAGDIKFKGHQLGSTEMSVSAWVYSNVNTHTWREVFRASNTSGSGGSSGDRILAARILDNDLQIVSSVDPPYTEQICEVANLSYLMTNTWVHIKASLSQTSGRLICCISRFSNPSQDWTVEPLASGTWTALSASIGKIIIGTRGSDESLNGRIVDYKFFPTQALTVAEFSRMTKKAVLNWAPSCNSCWGPDTFACLDYVQLVEPRTSLIFEGSAEIDMLGTQDVFDNYTYSATNWSVSSWIYRDSSNTPTKTQQALTVQYDQGGAGYYVSASIEFKLDNTIQTKATIGSQNSGTAYNDGWLHITLGVDATTLTACITPFNLSSPTTTCQSTASASDTPWDKDGTNARIYLGKNTDGRITEDFMGKMVDARYYPETTLTQTEAEALIAAFTCVGDSTDCTGPDVLSVSYLPLSEPDFEYTIYTTGNAGQQYFLIDTNHYNFMNLGAIGSDKYAFSVWVIGEERLDDAEIVRFYNVPQDGCLLTEARKTPAVEVSPTSTISYVDADGGWGQSITHTISSANHRYGTSFNTFVSTCDSGAYYNCYTEWGSTTACSSSTVSGDPWPQTASLAGFLGGTSYKTSQKLRVTNFHYYPYTCPSQSQISSSLSTQTCHTQCGGYCYGPGINSCIYDIPLYLSDEWEPWVGDGSTYVTKQGTDIEFESRYMKYPNYSLSLWFKLNTTPATGKLLVLAVMTDTILNITNGWLFQAPMIIIENGQIFAQIVTSDDLKHVTDGIDVNVNIWYFACVVVSQANQSLELDLAPFQGTVTIKSVPLYGTYAGYFTPDSYFYYGGVQTGADHVSLDGYILDIRFWDTKALSSDEVAAHHSGKGCYPNCSTCSSLEYNTCTSCASPYVLDVAGNECTYSCPSQTYSDGTQCQACDPNCTVLTCTGPNECSECNNPYYRLNGQCYTTCSEGYENQTSSPDFQCTGWYVGCQTCNSDAYNDCTTCTTGNFMQPKSASCYNTCPIGYITDSTTNSCAACPTNCSACTQLTECTSCQTPYVLRDDKLCYTACPDGQYADATRLWVSWYGTWATCDSWGENICITWVSGLSRLDSEAQSGSCDCSDTSAANKQGRIACLSISQATSSSNEEILVEFDDLIQTEVLTVDELTDVITALDPIDTSLNDTQSSEVLNLIQQAGMTTLINLNSGLQANELSVVTQKFDAQFELSTIDQFAGASVSTSTGSCVDIPSDLKDITRVLPYNAYLLFSVIQLKGNQTDVEVIKMDSLQIDINHIQVDKSIEKLVYENLTSNFTINYKKQCYDMEQTYKCMWFNTTSWSSSGCELGHITDDEGSCVTNHLTEFSIMNAADSAAVDNNAAATVNFSAVNDFDISKNPTPIIVCGTILVLFIITYVISDRLDRRDRKVAAAVIDDTFVVPITASTSPSKLWTSSDIRGVNESISKDLTSLQPGKQVDVQDIEDRDFNPLRGVLSERVHEPVIKQNIMKQNLEIHPMFGAFEEESGVPEKLKVMTNSVATPVAKTNSTRLKEDSELPDTSREQTPPEENQEDKPEFKKTFMASHPFFRIFVVGDPKMARTERLIIFLCVVMISILTTGMFFNTDEEEDEDDKSLLDTLTDYGWSDFWIAIYSSLITIPVPFILRFFYYRSEYDPNQIPWVQEQRMLRKRIIGHLLAFCVVCWCCWSVLAFSLEFGHNNTINWMLAFAGTEMFDLAIKDNLITLTLVIVIFCMINEKEKSLEQAGTLKRVIGHFI